MVSSDHPSFAMPAVVEALCEIHFRQDKAHGWEPSVFSDALRAVETDYPIMEPGFEIPLEFEIGAGGVGQRVLPPRPRVRFRHRSTTRLLQLSDGIFTANFLAPYPGWDEVRMETLKAWQAIQPAIGSESVVRIGLRYVNRVQRTSSEERAGEWLRQTEFVPPAVLGQCTSFLARIQVARSSEVRMIVTVGQEPPSEALPFGSFLLDIDRITEREVGADLQEVEAELSRMHDEVWTVFSASASARLLAQMKGAKP